MNCQICKKEPVTWSWQPDGPDPDPRKAFVLPGNHYHHFLVVKVCDHCKEAIQAGSTVGFIHQKQRYIHRDGQHIELAPSEEDRPDFYQADPHTDLWHGGTSSWRPDGTGTCTMICRDVLMSWEVHDTVALVSDPDLAELFLTAPQLLKCAEALQAIEHAGTMTPSLLAKAQEALADLEHARRVNAAPLGGSQ